MPSLGALKIPSSGVKPEPELTWDKIFFILVQLSLSSHLHFVIFENASIAAELLAALSREVNIPNIPGSLARIFKTPSLPFTLIRVLSSLNSCHAYLSLDPSKLEIRIQYFDQPLQVYFLYLDKLKLASCMVSWLILSSRLATLEASPPSSHCCTSLSPNLSRADATLLSSSRVRSTHHS